MSPLISIIDSQFTVNVKNAWKIYSKDKDKWYLFYAKTSPEKDQWLSAFKTERQRVNDDEKQGKYISRIYNFFYLYKLLAVVYPTLPKKFI